MQFLIVLSLAVACVLAAPQGPMDPLTTPIPILRMDVNNDNAGRFDLQYQTGNGISESQQGSLKNLPGDKEGPVQVTQGRYSYVGPDGVTYTVDWTSDENGFVARGDHLPTPPPIPEEIRRMLQETGQQADF